jgi:hypothetical protein
LKNQLSEGEESTMPKSEKQAKGYGIRDVWVGPSVEYRLRRRDGTCAAHPVRYVQVVLEGGLPRSQLYTSSAAIVIWVDNQRADGWDSVSDSLSVVWSEEETCESLFPAIVDPPANLPADCLWFLRFRVWGAEDFVGRVVTIAHEYLGPSKHGPAPTEDWSRGSFRFQESAVPNISQSSQHSL